MNRRSQSLRPLTTIRSGRFSSNTTDDIPIVKGRMGAFYRILNSGENSFTVDDGNESNDLAPNQSLDVAVTGAVTISISGNVPVGGIYEYLESDNPVRSGRFKQTVQDESAIHKIIDINGGGLKKNVVFYRVLNSGDWPIQVWAGNQSANAVRVLPENSLDLAIGSVRSINLSLKKLEAGTQPGGYVVEGIYDYLGTQNPVRSGRFKVRRIDDSSNTTIVDPSSEGQHKIIDFRNVGGKKAWYRVFNSGTNPMHIHGYMGNTMKLIATLAAGLSFDFELPSTVNSDVIKEVYVNSDGVDSPIEGIYEFLADG